MLPGPSEVSRTAELQVQLGDGEPVFRARELAQALQRLGRGAALEEQETPRLSPRAPDAAAQLVQLR